MSVGIILENNECCVACGNTDKLIRHHWYDTDDTDELPFPTVKNEPLYLEIRGILLFYHERRICLKCNRLLIQIEIRYFKGGGIKPFKYSDGSHIMPPWPIQKAFIEKYRRSEMAVQGNKK
jgi:hypothetical protein